MTFPVSLTAATPMRSFSSRVSSHISPPSNAAILCSTRTCFGGFRFVSAALLLWYLAKIGIAVAYAEDVTLFVAETPTPDGQAPVASLSVLGIRPLSVDDTGATHYVYSQIVSIASDPAGATTVTGMHAQDSHVRSAECEL